MIKASQHLQENKAGLTADMKQILGIGTWTSNAPVGST